MKYIAFYDTDDMVDENRSVAPSASNVVRYMAEIISEFTNIDIICPSRTLNKSGIYRGRTTAVSDRITLTHPFTFGVRTTIGRALSALWARIWLFCYLLLHTHRGEQIMVYHSLAVMKTVKLLKKLKHLTVISEVREIYTDVRRDYASLKKPGKNDRKTEASCIESADKFIFPSKLLRAEFNITEKPYVIAPAIYKPEPHLSDKHNDDKIHVVYAGTLRPEKGAAAAIAAAEYLDKRYHIHILGYGSDEHLCMIDDAISNVIGKTEASVTYDGMLRGDEFKIFLQSCHIGLTTQDPSGNFNNTSFPSKVLTYLANGLDVLSANIAAVKDSPVGEYIYYYEKQEPRDIARAIMSIDTTHPSDKAALLDGLHETLKSELRRLIIGGSGGNTV